MTSNAYLSQKLFEKLSPYFREKGHYVKAVNFLDMAHSDGWNCLYSLDKETHLVQTVANTIIKNTSGPREADDFWSRAELNLLMALLHYVCNLKDANGELLPIEQRGLGDVYQLMANKSIQEINRILAALPPEHPAKGHHGLFLKARENLWGNIAIGLGNRLAIFQNKLVDAITRNHDVDLLLPGKQPCAYFVIISAQTRSNTQRDLMLPDEVLRLDRRKCIALFQGHKPALLYKLVPEEFPDYAGLKSCRVIDYVPAWKRQEEAAAAKKKPEEQPPLPPAEEQAQQSETNPAEDLAYQIESAAASGDADLGMVEVTIDGVCGNDEDDDSPPGR